MRKIGIVCAIVGAVLAAGLFALQQTGWYASEALHRMSEPVEWIRSGLWAFLVLTALGLLLFGCSFRKPKDAAPPAEEPQPDAAADGAAFLPGVCVACGQPVPENAGFCRSCGAPQPSPAVWPADPAAAQDDAEARVTNAAVPPDAAGYRRPLRETNWECPWCGRIHDDSASVCTACGYERFNFD